MIYISSAFAHSGCVAVRLAKQHIISQSDQTPCSMRLLEDEKPPATSVRMTNGTGAFVWRSPADALINISIKISTGNVEITSIYHSARYHHRDRTRKIISLAYTAGVCMRARVVVVSGSSSCPSGSGRAVNHPPQSSARSPLQTSPTVGMAVRLCASVLCDQHKLRGARVRQRRSTRTHTHAYKN